ncbi:hypothetical protein JHV675_52470 [Mycobacterium avium subsp. hominissuis]
MSGTTTAFEYGMTAFLIGYGVLVFGLAALPSVRRAGMAVIIGNLLYTAAARFNTTPVDVNGNTSASTSTTAAAV